MSRLTLATIVVVATISLVACVYLGRTAVTPTRHRRVSPQLYRELDTAVCLMLGIYFLVLSVVPKNAYPLLKMSDIQWGGLFYLALDATILSFLTVRHIFPAQAFGVWKLQILQLIKSSVSWLAALYPLIFLVQIFSENLQEAHHQQPLVQFLVKNTNPSDCIVATFIVVVIAPLSEELIFRGYLYGVFRQHIGSLKAALITSILFAAIHQHLPILPGLFLLAVGLSLAYEATGCLLVPILIHSLFNFIGVLAAIL